MDATAIRANVKEVVPFLHVEDLAATVNFYVEGLGFEMAMKWEPEGELRWCWLTLGGASIMAQPARIADRRSSDSSPISLCFMCEDALAIYDLALDRGLTTAEPYVGNRLWVTSLVDPDGNRIDFESPTEVAEGTTLSRWRT